jgi:hypothetical protein
MSFHGLKKFLTGFGQQPEPLLLCRLLAIKTFKLFEVHIRTLYERQKYYFGDIKLLLQQPFSHLSLPSSGD